MAGAICGASDGPVTRSLQCHGMGAATHGSGPHQAEGAVARAPLARRHEERLDESCRTLLLPQP
jgi:hypothetical protein